MGALRSRWPPWATLALLALSTTGVDGRGKALPTHEHGQSRGSQDLLPSLRPRPHGRSLKEALCAATNSSGQCTLPQLVSCCTESTSGESCKPYDNQGEPSACSNGTTRCCEHTDAQGDEVILQSVWDHICKSTSPCQSSLLWTGSDKCMWAGVSCNIAGRVVGVRLYISQRAAGASVPWSLALVLRRLAALPLLTELRVLGNSLAGPVELPSASEVGSAFENLTYLELLGLGTSMTWPKWSLPNLEKLLLGANGLVADLNTWDLTAWPRLVTFNINNNSVTGSLPAHWAPALPSLTYIIVGYNRITGTLPPEWSSMTRLKALIANNNKLQGTLPETWGINGRLPVLQNLSVAYNNRLTGTLPTIWGTRGGLALLANFRMDGVSITGPIPVSFVRHSINDPDPKLPSLKTLRVSSGSGGLCAPADSQELRNLSLFSCSSDLQECNFATPKSLGWDNCGLANPTILAPAAPPSPAAMPTHAHIGAIGAGGAIGLLALVALAVCLGLLYRRSRRGLGSKKAGKRGLDKGSPGASQLGSPAKPSPGFIPGVPPGKGGTDPTKNDHPPREGLRGPQSGAVPHGAHPSLGLLESWPEVAPSPFCRGYESPQTVLEGYKAMARSSRLRGSASSLMEGSSPSGGSSPLLLRTRRRDIELGGGQSMRVSMLSGGRVRAALVQHPAGQAPGMATAAPGDGGARPSPLGCDDGTPKTPGGGLQLPELPFTDWELDPAEIAICRRPDGTPWKLGSGAYGSVFKAKFGGFDDVAVKIFHQETDANQEAAILKEVAILRGCRSDSIVSFLGACYEPGTQRMQLVMQYCAGGDLYSAIQDRRHTGELSWYQRGHAIALDIARGLNYLHHHRRLVHTDLKSGNVLLTATGSARLCDVGFADILDGTQNMRAAGFTFAWAAPELLTGGPCTAKVDIYSLGVVLWELARGLPPRRGYLRPCRVPEECPAEVEELLTACLAEDPEQRPTSRQVVERLLAVQDQPPPAGAGYVDESTM